MEFQGWLIKFGDVVLPNDFLLADGWESTPDQRVEINAYRDANVLLHRETSSNFKTSIKLNIRRTNLAERIALKNVIGLATLGFNEQKQRKVSITYWNDETLEYDRAEMYMTDTTYTVHIVDEANKDIDYNPFTLELVEY